MTATILLEWELTTFLPSCLRLCPSYYLIEHHHPAQIRFVHQAYSCGTGASAVTHGPFQIVYTLVHSTWGANLFSSGRSVTLVTAAKH